MLVNLSLQRSTKWSIQLERGRSYQTISPADGNPRKLEEGTDEWLTAGEGVLLSIV
jgi:hypothetical protein